MASQVLGLRPGNKIDLFLETRADALDRGDAGVYRAMCVELDRLGYTEPPAAPAAKAMEIATVQAPERAVPPAKRRRVA